MKVTDHVERGRRTNCPESRRRCCRYITGADTGRALGARAPRVKKKEVK